MNYRSNSIIENPNVIPTEDTRKSCDYKVPVGCPLLACVTMCPRKNHCKHIHEMKKSPNKCCVEFFKHFEHHFASSGNSTSIPPCYHHANSPNICPHMNQHRGEEDPVDTAFPVAANYTRQFPFFTPGPFYQPFAPYGPFGPGYSDYYYYYYYTTPPFGPLAPLGGPGPFFY